MNTPVSRPSQWWTALVLALCLALPLLFLWVSCATHGWPTDHLPNGFSSPVLALQFAGSGEDLGALLDPADEWEFSRRARLEQSLVRDFFFIGAYFTFFLVVSLLFAQSPRRWSVWLARVIVASALVAAVSDVLENWNCFKILAASTTERIRFLVPLHLAVYSKWALLFLLTACFGFLPIARPELFKLPFLHACATDVAACICAILGVLFAAIGLVCLACQSWIESAIYVMPGIWLVIVAWLALGFVVWFALSILARRKKPE